MQHPAPATARLRIRSIDILRGSIMLIMALDHVRDFFHTGAMTGDPSNLATTTPALYFTRWITHFCAPGFVLLSGMSAFISGRSKTKRAHSAFLIKRGLWLVFAEVFILTFILTFNPGYNLIFAAVIWAIGWSMVILGLLIRASYAWVLIVGLLLFSGHNITDHIALPNTGATGIITTILLTSAGAFVPLGGGHGIIVAYAILPWTGSMLLGYALGRVYMPEVSAAQRKKLLLQIGAGLLLLFFILRFINGYGDPAPWAAQSSKLYTVLSFLRVTKYPVSLQFACMTLGPLLLILAVMPNKNNAFTRMAMVYGRVPLFYFAGHFLLIHLLVVVTFFITGHTAAQISDPNSPFLFRPVNFGFPLWGVYLVWLLVLVLMYLPCRWFGRYKQTHAYWWLSYL